jgi:glutaredoxin
MIMRIQLLYILDCPWCLKTKELIEESLEELGIKAKIEEILIDTEEKAKKYRFVGSPTVRIDGKDIQEEVNKERCLSCEKLAETEETTKFVKQECGYGCRIYFYKGRQYPYPPKEMIKNAIRKFFK